MAKSTKKDAQHHKTSGKGKLKPQRDTTTLFLEHLRKETAS